MGKLAATSIGSNRNFRSLFQEMTKPKPRKDKLRDPERTRERLLHCAAAVFAKHGYEGARTEQIARRAGLSKTLIYHYFGSKKGLYTAALEAEVLALRQSHRDLDLRRMPPPQALRQLVESTFDYFVGAPQLISLLNTENLQRGEHIRASPTLAESYDPLIETIRDFLARGEADGSLRPGVDPLGLYLSIAAQSYHFVANRYTLGAVLHRDFEAPEEIARRREQIIDFTLAAVRSGLPG